MPRKRRGARGSGKGVQKAEVVGKGEYKLMRDMKKLIKSSLSSAASAGLGAAATALTGSPALGHLVHQQAGNSIGKWVNQVISGHGAYTRTVQYNDVVNDLFQGSTVRFGKGLDEDTMVNEGLVPIGDISMPASGEMTLQFRLNPNILNLPEGRAFQEWKMDLGVVEFHSMLGQGTSGAEGMLTIYHVRNPNMQAPRDYASAEKMGSALSVRLDEILLLGVECKESPWLLMRESNSDVVDMANTDYGYIGVHARPSAAFANQTIGRLYLRYRFRYRYPKYDPDFYAYAHVTSTSATSASPFGTTRTLKAALGACLNLIVGSTSVSLPNAQVGQTFLLTCYWFHGATAAYTAPTVAFTNTEGVTIFENTAKFTVSAPSPSVVSGQSMIMVAFRVTGTTPVSPAITLSGVVLPGSPAWMDLMVTPMPEGFANADL